MKLTLQHCHVPSSDDLDSLIEDRILALQPRLEIDEAHVRLERHHAESPAFSVRVHLVTPGPDVLAESREHTLRAAIEKALTHLEVKIGGRFAKRRQRQRSNLQEPAHFRMAAGRR